MKKFKFIALAILSFFSFNLLVNAAEVELPYDEFYTDGSSKVIGTAKITLPDNLTIKTENNSGAKVTLDYWYEADGGKVLEGYDTGLYLSVFAPVNEDVNESFNVDVTIAIPSMYNQKDIKVYTGDRENEVTYSNDGTITVTVNIDKTFYVSMSTYIFLKNNSSNTDDSSTSSTTLATDSSNDNAAVTTIVSEKPLPAGASLSVKDVEISKELKKAEKNLKKVFDISVLDANAQIIPISDNKMSITITLDDDLKGYNTYEVVYIKDGKVIERIPTTIKDGKLTFVTDHLSEYGIVAYNTVQTGDNIILYVSMFALALLGCAVVTYKKVRL